MVEQTQRNQNSDENNSINRLFDAIAGIATQERPQSAKCSNQKQKHIFFLWEKREI